MFIKHMGGKKEGWGIGGKGILAKHFLKILFIDKMIQEHRLTVFKTKKKLPPILIYIYNI